MELGNTTALIEGHVEVRVYSVVSFPLNSIVLPYINLFNIQYMEQQPIKEDDIEEKTLFPYFLYDQFLN